MAAVLCGGINQCCQGIGKVLSFPCRACGSCCNIVGDACSGCCNVLRQVLCTSPVTPYVILTLACQVAPVVYGIFTVSNPAHDCGFTNVWIYVSALLAISHIAGAFYIAYRMAQDVLDERANSRNDTQGRSSSTTSQQQQQSQQQQNSSSPPPRGKLIWEYINDLFTTTTHPQQRNDAPPPMSPQQERRGGANSWKRLAHLMCYDPVVAIYMVVFLFWVAWLPVGISTLVSNDDDNNNDDDGCGRVLDHARGSVICGFVYCLLVASSFCCSFLFLRV